MLLVGSRDQPGVCCRDTRWSRTADAAAHRKAGGGFTEHERVARAVREIAELRFRVDVEHACVLRDPLGSQSGRMADGIVVADAVGVRGEPDGVPDRQPECSERRVVVRVGRGIGRAFEDGDPHAGDLGGKEEPGGVDVDAVLDGRLLDIGKDRDRQPADRVGRRAGDEPISGGNVWCTSW